MVSKTKIGAVLIGASAVLATAAGFFTGELLLFDAVNALLVEVGAVCAVFGFRDLPIINIKSKK